jgi:hypothetical protein
MKPNVKSEIEVELTVAGLDLDGVGTGNVHRSSKGPQPTDHFIILFAPFIKSSKI